MADKKPKEKKESVVVPVENELEVVSPAEIDSSGQLILTQKHLKLIKDQIAPKSTQSEFELFVMMARRTRLDPLLKQLYFIKYGEGARANVSYVTSIDGYRIIAHRTDDFGGIDEPKYTRNNRGEVTHCTISVYKKDSDRPFSATVKFSEYTTGKNLWGTKPETMIAKVAEAHALRKAFPQDLSGIYTTDEMPTADERKKARPAEAMISKIQVLKMKDLMEKKSVDIDQMKLMTKKSCGVDTMAKVTFKQAQQLIKQLNEIPEMVVDNDTLEADTEEVLIKKGETIH